MNRPFTPILALLAAMMMFAGGCSVMDDALPGSTPEARQRVTELRAAADSLDTTIADALAEKDKLTAAIEGMEEGPARSLLFQRLNSVDEFIDSSRSKLNTARDALEAVENATTDDDSAAEFVGKGMQAVGSIIPPPYGVIVSTLGGLILAGANVLSRRKGQEQVAKAIEVAKVAGVVDFKDPETIARLNTTLGKSGKAAVDRVQVAAAA